MTEPLEMVYSETYIAGTSWVEAVAITCSLLVVGWRFAKRQDRATLCFLLGLVLTATRYGMSIISVKHPQLIQSENAYKAIYAAGAIGWGFLLIGFVLYAKQNKAVV